jgi:hypothetical protein
MKKAREIYVYFLAAIILAGYLLLIGCMMFKIVPAENKDLARDMFTTLSLIVVLVVKYFYDGNKETAPKNEMLYNSKPTDTKIPDGS